MKTSTRLAMALAVILVLSLGLALGAGVLGYGFPGGMMGGRGNYGFPGGMMGGWGMGGLLGMGLTWLIGIAFLAVLVQGMASLVRAASAPTVQPAPADTCPACCKNVQADWQNCPYCGRTLRS